MCCLMFGETYHYSDEEFKELRQAMHHAFHMINQDFEVEWIPFLRHLRYYKGKLDRNAFNAFS